VADGSHEAAAGADEDQPGEPLPAPPHTSKGET
jgi:hypothetical protein